MTNQLCCLDNICSCPSSCKTQPKLVQKAKYGAKKLWAVLGTHVSQWSTAEFLLPQQSYNDHWLPYSHCDFAEVERVQLLTVVSLGPQIAQSFLARYLTFWCIVANVRRE